MAEPSTLDCYPSYLHHRLHRAAHHHCPPRRSQSLQRSHVRDCQGIASRRLTGPCARLSKDPKHHYCLMRRTVGTLTGQKALLTLAGRLVFVNLIFIPHFA
jgi:hypothetical protein